MFVQPVNPLVQPVAQPVNPLLHPRPTLLELRLHPIAPRIELRLDPVAPRIDPVAPRIELRLDPRPVLPGLLEASVHSTHAPGEQPAKRRKARHHDASDLKSRFHSILHRIASGLRIQVGNDLRAGGATMARPRLYPMTQTEFRRAIPHSSDEVHRGGHAGET